MASHKNNKNRERRNPTILYPDDTVRSIPLAAINRKDTSFRITTRTDVEDLISSIECVGLMQPPLLKKKSTKYIPVSGFRRIMACQILGWSHIPAIPLNPAVDMFTCIQLAITENALQRPLNLVETARSLQMLNSIIKDHKHLAETAARLGLPSNPDLISKIEKICHLPWAVQQGILDDSISLTMALELSNFAPDVAVIFAQIFQDLKISLNKQRELLSLSREISLRENIDLQALIEGKEIKTILSDKNLDRNQKSQNLRQYLRQRRFPTIQRAEKIYQSHVKQLKLGNEIKLTPPKDFEGNTYILTLAFQNLSDLKTIRFTLDNIIQHPALKKILEQKFS